MPKILQNARETILKEGYILLEEKGYKYLEVPFVYMEKINNFKKVTSFLKAKFFKEKYEGSF